MSNRLHPRGRFVGLLCALTLFALTPHIAAARDVRVDKDVVYGPASVPKPTTLDVYEPDGFAGKRPAIVLIHGGGFAFGDKSFYAPMGKSLASKGYVVFSINYRLAPRDKYPAQVDDAQRAVRWIRANADKYHVDSDRIGALGDSAGGYLVIMLGTRDTRDNSDKDLSGFSSRVKCVVDFYGPSDFTLSPSTPEVSNAAKQILTAFFGKAPGEAPDLYKEGSPITYVDKSSASFLIIHGTKDPLVPVDQSQRLYDALQKAGVDVSLVLMYNASHGFLAPPEPKLSGALAEEFFARQLKP